MLTGDLDGPVYPKDPDAPICACFGLTRLDIEADVREGTDEPAPLHVAKARQPYEIVVNQVKKDRIVGYLATPKVQASR